MIFVDRIYLLCENDLREYLDAFLFFYLSFVPDNISKKCKKTIITRLLN